VFFIFGIVDLKLNLMFLKKAFSLEEQIQQLTERGLEIREEDRAFHFLSNISYYRLAGYWWPMQLDKQKHIFKANSRFSDVISLYNFDRELRILLFNAIERIEIALRTKLVYHLSHEFDPWWFQKMDIFQDPRELIKTLSSLSEEIERSKDAFIKEHNKKHKEDKRFPPAWKTLELASFGGLSKLYGNLKPTVKSKDKIAADFLTVNHTYLPSWLQSIAQIRNYCAHHSRLWNKNLPGRPKLLSHPPAPWIQNVPSENEHQMLYIHLCCIKYLLNVIEPANKFTYSLNKLFFKYPTVDPNALGMKPDWQKEKLWANVLCCS
jgi:abortive infection bacteriophage resistance protein